MRHPSAGFINFFDNIVKQVFLYYLSMALLNAKPQDCPVSRVLQTILIILYIILSVLSALSLYNIKHGLLHSLIDLSILFVFTQLLLRAKPQRINQTFNAFLGVGLCIGLIQALGAYTFIGGADEKIISDSGRIFFFSIFVWIVIAYGHIVRHAIEVSLVTGVSISLAYILISVFVLHIISQLVAIY